MDLRDAIKATAGAAPKPASPRQDERGRSTCTNCRNGDHNRCPTAITNHGRSSWSSDFDCACYHADEDMHAELVEADDEEFYQAGGWSGGDYYG